ncbi:hypothetical protein ACFOEW_13840 [Alteromonas oceani]|uniref:TIGR03067 domain-containing protein n=1 Tax=Alteromonas oceani TaxID=2071609 RepID=A0ABV7JXP9_9ALTE|nr:hypothetical protein [Alteromonas oceani]
MKTKFQVIFLFSLALFVSYLHAERLPQSKVSIVGHWVLNIDETIDNLKASDMTKGEVAKFSAILKPQEIVISEAVYSVLRPDQKPMNTAYTIESDADSEGCFILQFRDPRIPLDVQRNSFCVSEGKLLLPSPKNVYEVYNRKQ